MKMANFPKEYYKYGLLAGLGLGALLEYENLDIFFNTISRDVGAMLKFGRLLREYSRLQKQNRNIGQYFHETCLKYGDKVILPNSSG